MVQLACFGKTFLTCSLRETAQLNHGAMPVEVHQIYSPPRMLQNLNEARLEHGQKANLGILHTGDSWQTRLFLAASP